MRSNYERDKNRTEQQEIPSSFTRMRDGPSPRHRTELGEPSEPQMGQQSQKQRIIEQNIKLKQQIFDLSQQLQEILQKDRSRKRKYGGISVNDDDNTLREKKGQLRKQQLEITQMKGKIYSVKRQLEKVYNNRNLIGKEEQLRTLKQELKQLDDQKDSLLRIKRDQAKHVKEITDQQDYQERIDDLKKELARVKEEGKAINDKIIDSEKVLRKNHEQYIAKQEKLRELEQKVAAGKERLKGKKPLPTITPEMLRSLQDEIQTLEQQRRDNQKLWQQKIRAIDLQFQQKKLQEEKKLLILKQKQKEYRINELKIKQLRKLVRHNMAGDTTKKAPEVDMSQFRHKRNIKFLDK